MIQQLCQFLVLSFQATDLSCLLINPILPLLGIFQQFRQWSQLLLSES